MLQTLLSNYLDFQHILSHPRLRILVDIPLSPASDSAGHLYSCVLQISIKNSFYAKQYLYLIFWGIYLTFKYKFSSTVGTCNLTTEMDPTHSESLY